MRAYIQVVHTRTYPQNPPKRLAARRSNIEQFFIDSGLDHTTTSIGGYIGVHHSQVSRVLAGTSKPGQRFVAGLMDMFGTDKFGDMFDILPDNGGES